jgi:alkylation response protein AidB-like acyl-CoA dehydrogenase
MISASQYFTECYSLSGLDSQLTEEERQFQENLHRFAVEVMRPAGKQLDRMTAEQVIAPDSPLWGVFQEFGNLGISPSFVTSLEPLQVARLMAILCEELAWGDAGLAIALTVAGTPLRLAQHFQNEFLLANIPEDAIGCWAITEPDAGSDMVDFNDAVRHPQAGNRRRNCVARIEGDEVILSGQKSAWVSNGTIAQYAAVFCACERGNGPENVALVVPLDLPGVSRGKPLEKLGQRPLPQGEVFFENVHLSTDWLIAPVERYPEVAYMQLTEANAGMGLTFTGLARAAFEMALDYTHERKQGGVPIIRHQSVQSRLLHMFRKVEMSRALARRNVEYIFTAPRPALLGSIAAKITSTQSAFEVASEALQLFGGNGLTLEYTIEKLLRDARASMIEDGCNEVLAIKGGALLQVPNAG